MSRDIGDTHSIVFRDLAGAGVNVLDTGGLDASSDSGEMTVAMRSISNREYIKAVAKQTHRGLTGRALAGFWTGGKVYGYASIVDPNPPDIEHPRRLIQLDDVEAPIVRRVFEMFLAGAGLKAIADHLNREGIRAPHDNGRGHKLVRGWGHTTIRAMLRNERYVGKWVWNATKWHGSSTGKPRRVSRPKSEHVIKEYPELAIIDRATWDRVAAKLQRQTDGRGRPPGTGVRADGTPRAYLTSGLLRCASCGGSMSVVGQNTKAGVRYATFGCAAHYSRGESICPC